MSETAALEACKSKVFPPAFGPIRMDILSDTRHWTALSARVSAPHRCASLDGLTCSSLGCIEMLDMGEDATGGVDRAPRVLAQGLCSVR